MTSHINQQSRYWVKFATEGHNPSTSPQFQLLLNIIVIIKLHGREPTGGATAHRSSRRLITPAVASFLSQSSDFFRQLLSTRLPCVDQATRFGDSNQACECVSRVTRPSNGAICGKNGGTLVFFRFPDEKYGQPLDFIAHSC